MSSSIEISIVVPIFNDGELADAFCTEFESALKNAGIDPSTAELIFVDDGSHDYSIASLKQAFKKFNFVKVVFLSRNFGQHIAISCGYREAKGRIVGMLNVDMQDPPSEIPKLIRFLDREGFDIVVGIRDKQSRSLIEFLTSRLFNLLMRKLTNQKTPLDAATLRLMNRRYVDAYNSLTERSRFIPGLEDWLGFKKGYLPIAHHARKHGKSSYSFWKRAKMAINGVISFSDLPLRIAIHLGFAISGLSFLMSLALVVVKILYDDYVMPGYASLFCALSFLSGLNIIVVGIAGLYIGRILSEVQARPLYIVREKLSNDHN